MWTLGQARTRLGERLAEVSVVFWTEDERDHALNEAQRFVAAVTKGVPLTLSGSVDTDTPYLPVTGTLLGEYAVAGRVDGGRSLNFVSQEAADRGFPTWTTFVGTPRWIIPAANEDRVYLSPAPTFATPVTVNVSVLPPEMGVSGDILFGDATVMEKYQGVVLNIAAALSLLKERYDGDAERFYQFARQELQDLGVTPASIPQTVQEVPSG